MNRRSLIALVLLAFALPAACETVLGFEDHELYPADASVGGGSGGSAGSGGTAGAAGSSTGGSAGVAGDADADIDADADAGPARVTDGLIALYTFDEGSGTEVKDVSGVAPPLNLTIDTPSAVVWNPGFIDVTDPVRIRSGAPAQKVFDKCTASEAITVEAWVKPGTLVDLSDGAGLPSRIVSMSIDGSNRNFTLAQDLDQWVFRLRRKGDTSYLNGTPALTTASGTVTTTLAHVVATRGSTGPTSFYLDAVPLGTEDQAGDFSEWDPSYELALANEVLDARDWVGELHLVAIYDRALSLSDIQQNFAVGPD
jgi:Concanavalin A-like lectin/glucanases superfamily